MKKRVGLSGALGAIAVTLAMSSVATPAVSLQVAPTEQAAIDPDVLCKLILGTTTADEFKSIAEAVAAFNDPANACHDVATKHYVSLTRTKAEVDSGSITGDGNGYNYR